jgi:hypothetical protein
MGHEMRWGGLAGFGAVVLFVIGRLLFGSPPPITATEPVIAAYLAGHRIQIMLASLLYAAAIVLAVWFGAELAAVFRRAGETGVLPMLVLGGFVLIGAVGLFLMLTFAGVTYALATNPQLLALAGGPFTALTVAGILAGVASALPLGAAAVAIARTGVFPMWLAWLAGVVAVVRVLAAFGVAAGLIAPGAIAMHIVIGVLAASWLLAMSWLLVREHLPAGTSAAVRVRHA